MHNVVVGLVTVLENQNVYHVPNLHRYKIIYREFLDIKDIRDLNF